MRTRIVRIGNSQGVRIPKPVLKDAGFEDEEVDLRAENGRIVITRARGARAGWAEAAKRLHAAGGDVVESTGGTEFDRNEWEWR